MKNSNLIVGVVLGGIAIYLFMNRKTNGQFPSPQAGAGGGTWESIGPEMGLMKSRYVDKNGNVFYAS